MEFKTFKKNNARSLCGRAASLCLLRRYAARVIRCTERSDLAKQELLFSLPGIFSLELCFSGVKVRLIKEGDVFRFMEKKEKHKNYLCVTVTDKAALKALACGELTVNRCAAQGRLEFCGRTPFFTAFTRVLCEGDKALLSKRRYRESYLL